MPKTDYEIYQMASEFYFFDSLGLSNIIKKFKTDIERVKFFDAVKIECETCSKYCELNINRILNSKNYEDVFVVQQDHAVIQNHPYYTSFDSFMKELFKCNGNWSHFFFLEDDYNFILKNLDSFFKNKSYDSITKTELKPNCTTKLCTILHDIYFFCSPTKHMKQDKKFLSLVKNLSPFSKFSTTIIYNKLIHY